MLVRPREPCQDHHLTRRTARAHAGIVLSGHICHRCYAAKENGQKLPHRMFWEPNLARRSGKPITNLSVDLASSVHEGHLSHLASPLSPPRDLTHRVRSGSMLATNPATDFRRRSISWKQSIPMNIAFCNLSFKQGRRLS